jgi:hypothetical protein
MSKKQSIKIGIYTIDISLEKNNLIVSLWDTTNLTQSDMPQYIGEHTFKLENVKQ